MLRNFRRCTIILVLIFIFSVTIYEVDKIEFPFQPELVSSEHSGHIITEQPKKQKGFANTSYKVLHLDLKGAPPKMSYLKQLLPLLAHGGCDTLLLEYEDMFPYTGIIANLSAKNAYTRKEVRQLLTWAHDLGLQIIPLVQTFGHLEHALKLAEWAHLRELPPYPQELCPTNEASFSLVTEMISQVMAMHSGSLYIHLGGDEVFHIGLCPRCVNTFQPASGIYTRWMVKVSQWVVEKYPGIQPIIWDDMMRSWHPQQLKNNPLLTLVQPMVWAYSRNVPAQLHPSIWYWYEKLFKKVWVAGVFKGATLPTSTFPNMEAMYENQKSWMKFLSQNSRLEIIGYVLTGWSRYDHFAVLCETLPASIPSLFLNLVYIYNYNEPESVFLNKVSETLQCKQKPPKDLLKKLEPNSISYFGTCTFPGVDAFNMFERFVLLKEKIESFEVTLTKHQGWMTKYNVRHNFTSPWKVIDEYLNLNILTYVKGLETFKNETFNKLIQYIDEYSTNEWIEQNILPLQNIILSISKTLDDLIVRENWPRRPIP